MTLDDIVFKLNTSITTQEFFICLTQPKQIAGYIIIVPNRANFECILNRMRQNSLKVIINHKYKIPSCTIQEDMFANQMDDVLIDYNKQKMEEYSLEIKGELQQIFKVLSKQQHDKMPFEGIEIAKSLSRLPFFRRFFDTNSEHFINLCIAQDAIIIPQGTSVYTKQVNDGRERYIYVVLEGRFSLSSEECPSRQLRLLRIFGQTEILFGLQFRKETAIALEQSKVMRIKESAVLKIFNKRDEIKKCLHFMDVNEYFQGLKELQKMQLSLSMVRHSFQKGTSLKLEGDKFDEVLFFIYGKVEVSTHILKNKKDKEYVIDFLEELSTFGEYQSVNGIGTALKLRGIIAGAYYSLNYSEVKKQNHTIAGIIEENAIPYPSHQELQFLQGVKSTLKNQEKRVIKHLNVQH